MSSTPSNLNPKHSKASVQPQFQGLGQALGAAAMLTPVVSTFSALDQKNSMMSVAARDGFDSSGRIYQEFQRNKYGGWESLVNEGSAMLVWGFGITLCKQLYDQLVPQLSKGKILFPGLENLDLLPKSKTAMATNTEKTAAFLKDSAPVRAWNELAEKPGFNYVLGKIGSEPDAVANRAEAHVLDAETVHRYYKNTDALPLETSKGQHVAAKHLKNDFEARKQHLLALVEEGGKNKPHLERYMRNNILKLVLCTTLPSMALGLLIPQLLHWLTPKLVRHDREQAMLKPAPGDNNNTFKGATAPGIGMAKEDSPFHSVQMQGSFASHKQPPQFSGAASILNPAVSWLLARDTIATMLFVDFPLSGGRVATARNKDERDEIIFREVAIIGVLFWAQRAIQERIAKAFDKNLGSHTGIEIKALHQLYTHFAQQPASQFGHTMKTLQHTLGLATDSATSLDGEKKLVAAVRQYFSDERQGGRNLLFDLAEASNKISTLGQGSKKAIGSNGVHYIDLTKKIDTDGIREIAQYLGHLEGKVAQGKTLSPMLAHNALMKMGSFGLSALACWTIVSYIVPKGQHAITSNKRGVDQFPGLDNVA